MDTAISAIEATYNILKAAKAPLTHPEIMEELKKDGYKVTSTIIYPLIDRGWVKRGDKDGRAAYSVVEGVLPIFGQGRAKRVKITHATGAIFESNKLKRKYTRKATEAIVVQQPQQVTLDPVQIAEQAREEMAHAYNSQNLLKNSAAVLKFTELLERIGPDQALLMLLNFERMAAK